MEPIKIIQSRVVLFLSIVLTPLTSFSYTVLWDTSHGVYVPPADGDNGYQPSGYYQTLTQHLVDNGFTVDTTSDGFLVDDPGEYDVIVVCLASAYDSVYTPTEVERIENFVDDGGGLLLMGDQQFNPNANIQPVASQFGIGLGISTPVPDEIYTSDVASHPIFDGVGQIFMYVAGELSASGSASAVAWQEESPYKPIGAVAQYGQGRVVALGDCSLWTVSEAYWDYFHEADNPEFSLNTFNYLAVPEPGMVLLLGLGAVMVRRKR
ncbi:MAG: PEP-CTERM sorting domain-containing protein [Planctomycetota bacterium]|jgi:hypothetical protein